MHARPTSTRGSIVSVRSVGPRMRSASRPITRATSSRRRTTPCSTWTRLWRSSSSGSTTRRRTSWGTATARTGPS
ncbi:hypothetical protein ACFPRL_03640 [Pseudoclavibacter helvolus]